MVSLRMENDFDVIEMTEVETDDYGLQVISGATGFGLPPVDLLWSEGAGDGSRYRGRRVLQRPMDIPIYIRGRDRTELKLHTSRVARMLANQVRLIFVEDERNDEWVATCARSGGGDWTYGEDTDGATEAKTIVTLVAGDPYWTSTKTSSFTVAAVAGGGLLSGSLSKLNLSSGQSFGSVKAHNAGDVAAFPVWRITGPGVNFRAVSPSGEVLSWQGTIPAGRVLTIDTRAGTAIDDLGVNRYSNLATRPRFWTLPAGDSIVTVQLDSATAGVTRVDCTWNDRRWVSI